MAWTVSWPLAMVQSDVQYSAAVTVAGVGDPRRRELSSVGVLLTKSSHRPSLSNLSVIGIFKRSFDIQTVAEMKWGSQGF